jgi:hypothetical protein
MCRETWTVLCVMAALTQAGCRSVYRLQCTAWPPVAGVLCGEQVMGETPCTITIPRKSKLIHDDKVEMTFCLPDGRQRVHVVDLHGLKPSNPLAEIAGAPFLLAGAGLLLLAGNPDEDEEDEEESPFVTDHKKGKSGHRRTRLLGLGVMLAGGGLYHLFGGDADSLSGYEVHVDFRRPTGGTEK